MSKIKADEAAVTPNNGAILGKYTGKCCDSNVFNNNEMFLNRELFENVIASDEYKDAIERGHYIGFLGHPEDPGCQEFRNACIVMREMTINDEGEIEGVFDLINTPVGQIVKAFQDAGVKFGISIRGAGDVDGGGNVDPETFVFRGFDLVAFPAYNDCVPEFQAIAASEDLATKSKYKKVCATVKRNLSSITACNTLKILQDQFREGTDEYNAIQEQIDSLGEGEPVVVVEETSDIENEKLDGVMQLYLAARAENKELQSEVADLSAQLATAKTTVADTIAECDKRIDAMEIECNRKLARMKQIMGGQMKALDARLKSVQGSYAVSVKANNKLKDELDSVMASESAAIKDLKNSKRDANESNLKYQQKIESAENTIKDKDKVIASLEAKMRETVTSSQQQAKITSNLEDKVKRLESKIAASDEIILSYQQAYANIYANALGVCIKELPITATTSVETLQQMIKAGTNTANMSNVFVEPQPVEIVEDDEFSEDDMITI